MKISLGHRYNEIRFDDITGARNHRTKVISILKIVYIYTKSYEDTIGT